MGRIPGTKVVRLMDELQRLQKENKLIEFEVKRRGTRYEKIPRFEINGSRHSELLVLNQEGKSGYDNLVLGNSGSTIEGAYLLNRQGQIKKVPFQSMELLKANNFVVLNEKLFHIPSGCSRNLTNVTKPYNHKLYEHSERPNTLTVEDSNTQFIYDGTSINIYTPDLNAETVSQHMDNDIYDGGDPSEVESSSEDELTIRQKRFREVLKEVIRENEHIVNAREAEMYLNDNLEFSEEDKVENEFIRKKREYVFGAISLSELEDFLDTFFDENGDYVYVTGENSDKAPSDIEYDDDDDDGMLEKFL